jgi:hypothetical protein
MFTPSGTFEAVFCFLAGFYDGMTSHTRDKRVQASAEQNWYGFLEWVQHICILADEIATDIVDQMSTLNPAQLSRSVALIQSPGLDLMDEVYEDAGPADILTRLAALGDTSNGRWEVGVEGQTLFFRPQGDVARAWYVDATELSVSRSLDDLANVVYATYQDATGRRIITGNASDLTSIARYGVIRFARVSVDTTSATQAGTIRNTALADQKDPLPQADIHFEAIYDATGAQWPLWEVAPGDTITIRNLPPDVAGALDRVRTFRVSHTSYDPIAKTLEIEPEAPTPTLETMLARQAAEVANRHPPRRSSTSVNTAHIMP